MGMPALKGASASARWQKPWMVKIEASSKLCSACSSRSAISSSARLCCCRATFSRALTNESDMATVLPRNAASVVTTRLRMRSCNSAVAALVKVTTRMPCTSSRRSSSSRSTRPQMFQVLPVPAEASINCVPCNGQANTSNAGAVMAAPGGRPGCPAVVPKR